MLTSKARDEAAQAQRQEVCGDGAARIGLNDNLKEGNYVWVDGSPGEGPYEPMQEPGLISGFSGDPIEGDAEGAAGLIEDGGALQDGVVGAGAEGGAYLTSSPGGPGTDYLDEGEPVALDYDFGEEVTLGSLYISLYNCPMARATRTRPRSSASTWARRQEGEVAEELVVSADLNGPPGQLLFLGAEYVASRAHHGHGQRLQQGADGGDRVGLTEAYQANAVYTNWAPGEPNDWAPMRTSSACMAPDSGTTIGETTRFPATSSEACVRPGVHGLLGSGHGHLPFTRPDRRW